MNRSAPITILAAAILGGCSSPDHAIFVTSTNIGINADATTRIANIGYDRTEGFIGPAYPETGALPPVLGFIDSDIQLFSPHIKQAYATGDAAIRLSAALSGATVGASAPKKLTGERRVVFVGTSSSIGMKIGFSGTAAATLVPDSIVFGYKRKEASIIPLRRNLLDGQEDNYGSVLASFAMDTGSTNFFDTHVAVAQFIATGAAADYLAPSSGFTALFQGQMKDAITKKAKETTD